MRDILKYTFFLIIINATLNAQNDNDPDYFRTIPDHPVEFNAKTTIARMVDGLGYRYYWATDSLRQEDLDFKPSSDSRTTRETLEHIYSLSRTTSLSIDNKVTSRSYEQTEMDWQTLREKTLAWLQQASLSLRSDQSSDMKDMAIRFKRGENEVSFPFWSVINGPLSDAIYHTGQIVSNRRCSGNPLNPNVSVFSGKTR